MNKVGLSGLVIELVTALGARVFNTNMNQRARWFGRLCGAAILAVSALFIVVNGLGLRYNRSPSVPIGLWQKTSEPLQRGSYVTLDEPIKQVAGIPGDAIMFTPRGVYVNNKLWPDSAPVGPHHVPFGTIILRPGEYLLMGKNPSSFDGRYFGWMPATLINGTVRPIWVKP
jgi:type IV secretory pathway protease TraF